MDGRKDKDLHPNATLPALPSGPCTRCGSAVSAKAFSLGGSRVHADDFSMADRWCSRGPLSAA